MEDEQIVSMYWNRKEQALIESSNKYGAYCHSIAFNILSSKMDAEECVNDTWLNAWNTIPPNKPFSLASFLGRITRNLAFNRYKLQHRIKRGGTNMTLVLDELSECVSGLGDVEKIWQRKELIYDINKFLSRLSKKKQYIFILRYWYANGIGDIAERFGTSENNVSVILNRIRKELKKYLLDKGYDL